MTSLLTKVVRPAIRNNRSFTSVLDDAAIKAHAAEEVNTWRKLSFISMPFVIVFGMVKLSADHSHHGEHPPAYEYLRIRAKPFPWGNDGLFEVKHAHDEEDDE
eukprot:TRINITY_DN269_c0_g1_i4.p4 TRINITY_DN269_c0_g1~~TRINITY_DN269_c0_g1_i4.p4  ORF type:complete len:103 (-),score=27.81 TRINITY_DN269_c0_g1_i4:461-769(-)